MSSVLDFRHCYVAGSVALGYGDEFFDAANKAARSLAMMSYSHDIEIRPSQLGERWTAARRGRGWLARCRVKGIDARSMVAHFVRHPAEFRR